MKDLINKTSLQYLLIAFIFLVLINGVSSDLAKTQAFNPEELSSLVFVFDVTGSMLDELDQVKKEISKILKTIAEHGEKVIYNYGFVPFNDPLVGPYTVTTNISEFENTIQNVVVGDGGDCPENSLTGIMMGLEISLPKSFIFVVTDAHPKDTNRLQDVIALIRQKNSQIIFLLTGTCTPEYPHAFKQIASISTGQIFNLAKTDVRRVLEFIRVSLHSNKVNLLAVDSVSGTGNSVKQFSVAIDETVTQTTISVSGKEKIALSVTDPSRKRIENISRAQTLLNLDTVKIISITHPHPGIWNVGVLSNSSYTVRITGKSNVSFTYGFSVEYTANINNTNIQPFKGIKNFILVKLKNLFQTVNLTVCECIDLNGRLINSISLKQIEGFATTYYGTFVPKDTNFHLQVNGNTTAGFVFKRITFSAVHSDPSALVISLVEKQSLLLNQNYSLKCIVESGQPFSVQWLKNGIPLRETSSNYNNHSITVTLEFPEVSFADAGNYTCQVQRDDINKSKSASIRIIDPPSINQNLSLQIQLKWNDDYAIPCSAKGYPEPKISWIFNHSDVIPETQNGDNLIILSNRTLLLLNAVTNQSGFYSCIAENEAGKDSRYYEVTVMPGDTGNSDSRVTLIKTVQGEKAELFCLSNKNDSVEWLKNGLPLDLTTNDRSDELRIVLKQSGNKLVISDTYTTDSGNYTCVSTNGNGSSSHTFLLRILVPPSFTDDGETVVQRKVQDLENVTLDCTSDAYPAAITTWRKRGFMWPINSWTLTNVTLSSPNKQTLTIYPFRKDLHLGLYECKVENEVSTIYRNFTLF